MQYHASSGTCRGLHAGRLNRRLTIQQPTATTDGEPNPSAWTAVATVWAQVQSTSGNERLRGRQVDATVTTLVTIRHRTDIERLSTWRFLEGTRVLNPVAVYDPDGQRVVLECQCKEAG